MSQAKTALKLFPPPSTPIRELKTVRTPRLWPGRSPASTSTLLEILKDNHKRWHIFFNNQGFHNHSAHTAVAMWALGADSVLLKAAYEQACAIMSPAYESPSAITKENWREHLGDRRYYDAYLTFFTRELEEKGTESVLEEYIFSPAANFVSGREVQPEMLNRMLDSLLHPMIHVGYGLEFNLPGLTIEGLAQAAIHQPTSTVLIPASLFDPTHIILSKFSPIGLSSSQPAVPTSTSSGGCNALTVLARILKDPKLGTFKETNLMTMYSEVITNYGKGINSYVDQWDLEGDVEKKVEELIWVMTLIYGVCGNEPNAKFNADFFHAHLVTSTLFLPTWIAHLKPQSHRLLLRSFFSVALAWYISRGRPSLDLPRFFSDPSTLRIVPPGPQPTPSSAALASSSPQAITPNPWLPIMQTTLVHLDEHISKLQRALAHFAELYEQVDKGYLRDTELEGAEVIDGTLFLRVAGLSASRMRWLREGENPIDNRDITVWDRRGFFENK